MANKGILAYFVTVCAIGGSLSQVVSMQFYLKGDSYEL